MEFLFKTTVWESVKVSDDQEKKVLSAIKGGKICSSEDVFNFLADEGDMNVECETILNTSEQMSVEENGGQSTIEVHDDDKLKPIWQNGK